MLGKFDAMTTLGVRDLAAARQFYENILGLSVADDTMEGTVRYESGGSSLFVYVSSFAGTNKATAASWQLGSDLDAVVADLKRKGVTFEHYDMPGMHLEGDVHVAGDMKIAWFKDPDGNILALDNG
jgi:catechol 2,3-dioxygenase-like lactoylglutathione lyase family enzyme